ncbi:MAG: recombinase family protein [Gammaproteobacteria bacterium]|nr:recombinase family protein [Gammaproteobacteria bacterium]
MKCAIYTRYSSDRQREASTEDQARNCRARIEAEGWTLAHHYRDEAMSGSITARPGYQALLAAAERREFDVIVVDDLSRLSRDQVEGERAIRRIEFAGIRILALSDGYDSTSKSRKIQRGVKGLMNELYLDDLRDKTHRGLTGQALQQFSAGGKAYGYRPVRVTDPTRRDAYGEPAVLGSRREIDQEQAPNVVTIFERYAAGAGLRTIASELNARGIPAPGATWNRTVRRTGGQWLSSAIREILQNPMYDGRYIWNRGAWQRDPETKRRKRTLRPESEWIVHVMPELRIVSPELWKAAQSRMRARAEAFPVKSGQVRGRGAQPRHALSGLLRCAECGCAFIISGTKPARYVCSSHRNGGQHACSTGLGVSKHVAESALLPFIEKELLTPEALGLAESTARQEARRMQQEQRAKPQQRTSAVARLDQQVEDLERLLREGTLSPAVAGAALEKARSDRQSLVDAGQAAGERGLDKAIRLLPRIAAAYRRQVQALIEGRADPATTRAARSALLELFGGPVRLTPAESRDHLVAEVSLSRAVLLQAAGGRVSNGSGGRIALFPTSPRNPVGMPTGGRVLPSKSMG